DRPPRSTRILADTRTLTGPMDTRSLAPRAVCFGLEQRGDHGECASAGRYAERRVRDDGRRRPARLEGGGTPLRRMGSDARGRLAGQPGPDLRLAVDRLARAGSAALRRWR